MGAHIFALSDHHFYHDNTWKKFRVPDWKNRCGHTGCDYGRQRCRGTHPEIPLRPFISTEEMNELMVERHNATVRPQDIWYCGGDVVIAHKPRELDARLPILSRLNGHGRLILGNHCHWKMDAWAPYFEKIFSSRLLDHILFTHIPIHPSGLSRFPANVHGHVHSHSLDDARYLNMCVEVNDYTPIALEAIKARLRDAMGSEYAKRR